LKLLTGAVFYRLVFEEYSEPRLLGFREPANGSRPVPTPVPN